MSTLNKQNIQQILQGLLLLNASDVTTDTVSLQKLINHFNIQLAKETL